MKKRVAIAMLLVGVALMVTSLVWPQIAATRLFFDEAQGAEYQQAVAEMHGLQAPWPRHGEPQTDPGVAAQRQQAQQRFKQAQDSLIRARRLRESGSMVLRVAGIVVAIAGLGVFYIQPA